jgi:glycosyltransferase involved in cell wall biosynthesis
MYLSVVVPCFNERENIARGVLSQMMDFLAAQPYASELIVSDDGSTDDSLRLVQEFAADQPTVRVVPNAHAGKPFALRSALAHVQGDIVLLMDMDQSAPLSEVTKLLPYFEQGYAVVIGSRGAARKNSSLLRKAASQAFRAFRKSLILRDIDDTQCGFKAARREVLLTLFERLQVFRAVQENVSGWRVTAYDVEMLFVAEKMGHRVKEVPVLWQQEDVSTGKQKSFVRESREMLSEVLRVKWNDLRGQYNA